jgi:outer membrane protein OmpA-like peptidoglycan-associated protein/tetratricopeptide (TPR) repeat protein
MKRSLYLKHIVLLTVSIMVFNVSYGQKAKIARADTNFDRYSFIDAQAIYLKVVEDGYTSADVYQKLGDTYYFNSDYINAEKWLSRSIAEYPSETLEIYYYRAAQASKSVGNKENFENYIKTYFSMSSNENIDLNVFIKSEIDDFSDFEVTSLENINSDGSDFGPVLFNDKLFFSSAAKTSEGTSLHKWNKKPFLDLYEVTIGEEGNLGNPQSIKGDVNTPYHESTPTFTKDGKTVYFTRNNYSQGKRGRDKKNNTRLKVYTASISEVGSWTNVIELPFNSDAYSTAHPALSPNGKRLYFASDMPGTLGQSDLWYVDINSGGNYGDPVNMGENINSIGRESFPFISDMDNLYFSSDSYNSYGGFDIYISKKSDNGNYESIKNIGNVVNGNSDDFAFVYNEEAEVGYFSSNRGGNSGSSSDDIYKVHKKVSEEEECTVTIQGTITDISTGIALANSTVMLLDNTNASIETTTTNSFGVYSFEAPADCNKSYVVRSIPENGNVTEEVFVTPDTSATIEVDMAINVDPCALNDLGCRLDLQPIFFDYGKSYIRPDATVELAKILATMREYPALKIDIESHTDSRSSSQFNEVLSENRAQNTLEWLVNKGIDRNRLSAKGYGENRLVNECFNGVDCAEDAHQLNRRSMFMIKN